MDTHFTKCRKTKIKMNQIHFCKSVSCELPLDETRQGHQARKWAEKFFSGLKTAKKQPKLLKNAFISVKFAS